MKNKVIFYVGLCVALLLAASALYIVLWLFEDEPPFLNVSPKKEILGKENVFTIQAKDSKRGLRKIVFSLRQGLNEKFFFEEDYTNIPEKKHIKSISKEIILKPLELGFKDGDAILSLVAYDRSFKNGQNGNKTTLEWKVTIDTVPPFIRTAAPYHYFNAGGTGVVVYETAKDSVESGVKYGENSYKGFWVNKEKGLCICYFPIPQEVTSNFNLSLYSKDQAGNETMVGFNFKITPKKFRKDIVTITEDFIEKILPYFESIGLGKAQRSAIEWFSYLNNEQRKKDELKFSEIAGSSYEAQLWEGTFLRMKDAAPMAGFGDRRSYKFKDQLIGESVHKGVDLASLEHSQVEAANRGKVVFQGDMGIYGRTVVIDHGQGLFSTYSHLSEIRVEKGQEVSKGEVIGVTGRTGLAGGDHLHFGIMVHGVFVNPVEWWDPLWVKEKILRWVAAGEINRAETTPPLPQEPKRAKVRKRR